MSVGDMQAGRQVSAYLGLRAREVGGTAPTDTAVEGRVELRRHLRGPGGSIRAGALLTLVDSVAGWCGGLAALPDGWVVSTNLLLRTVATAAEGPLRVDARVLRRGRSAVVTDARVTDEATTRVVAEGVLTSAVLVPEGGPPAWPRPAALDVVAPAGDLPPIVEGFGIRPASDGAGVVLEVVDGVRNPWGIVHGGVIATLVDAAAEQAVEPQSGHAAAVTDVALHFLAPGRWGPLTARGTLTGVRADGHVVRVEVCDEGAGGRRLAVAIATVVPVLPGPDGSAPSP